MDNTFGRNITLLRKERGLSQKQASVSLGVSQPLLSHYEKGVRECGLDFIIKAAKFYDVSADFLLGLSTERNAASLGFDTDYDEENDAIAEGSSAPLYNKRVAVNTINLIYELLVKLSSRKVINQISTVFGLSIYKIFRIIYSSNKNNPREVFSVDEDCYLSFANAEIIKAEAKLCSELQKSSARKSKHSLSAPELSPDIIERNYPKYSSALSALLTHAEKQLK